jgi:monofunctional biosynthetic peptidoglycan transglycosylase
MQCARNVFLWQGRNYIRKGLEVYFTYLMEFFWSKKRILEVYVNVIEWGDGVYGVEAASKKYFGVPASQLTARQAALLAAVLPNPRRWSPAEPTSYINGRAATIQRRASGVSLSPLKEPNEPGLKRTPKK